MQVPKTEFKYLISPMDAIRTQLSFLMNIGPKRRSFKAPLDYTEMTIIACIKLQSKEISIQELCDLVFPEIYGSDEGEVSEHIRKQQIRNRINGLVKKEILLKVPDPSNKRVMRVVVTDKLQLSVPEYNSMIVYKLFTPQPA